MGAPSGSTDASARNLPLIVFTLVASVICCATTRLCWVGAGPGTHSIRGVGGDAVTGFIMEAWELVKKNQFCQALVFSSVSYYVMIVTGYLYRTAVLPLFSGMSSSIVLHNTDPNFNNIIDYLAENIMSKVSGLFSSVQATTKKRDWTRKDWIQEWLGTNTNDVPVFEYRPDNDNIIHSFIYRDHTIYLSRAKSGDALMGSDSEKPFTPESLTLTVWGADNKILQELMTEALVSASEKKREDMLNIFMQCSSSYVVGWELALTKKARQKESVILDVDDMDFLLNDARKFLQSKSWYLDKGIPYRRGYMLYGPPGCGKTSFAQVLAGELKLDICMLALTHAGLTDNQLCELLRDAPRNSLIVLEDVDAVFVERNATGGASGRGRRGAESAVSFSGLLNAIDGVASQEGKIFFMTTNHIEKLDAALLRPGRCDVKFEVKNASKQQMERMFLRFYPGEDALATQFASRLPANELSMATLQGHFLNDAQLAEESLERISELVLSVKSTDKRMRGGVADCLFRVGIERYAHLFNFQGCRSAADMNGIAIDSLLSISMDLRYDPTGKKNIEKILSGDEQFVLAEFTMATIPEIRSAFLAAFPTTHERLNGEISPFLRRQTSHSKICHMKQLLCSSMDLNIDVMPEISNMSHGSTFDSSTAIGCVSPEELDALSQRFCEALSRNGKGAVSLYNLKFLLEMNPNRPHAALEYARHFVFKDDNLDVGVFIRPTSLYDFLKRAGMGDKYYKFAPKINSIQSLKEIGDLSKNLMKPPFKLSEEDALCLDELLNEEVSETGNLMNFSYHDRRRIMSVFMGFYTNGHFAEAQNTSSDNTSLEMLAYQYAVAASSPKGNAFVSILEVIRHLKKHRDSPEEAVCSVISELVSPTKPIPPESQPPALGVNKQWIESWLESGPDGNQLVQYAPHFMEAGICTEEDLRLGGAIDDSDLKDIMKINKLGHLRKVMFMQEKFFQVDKP